MSGRVRPSYWRERVVTKCEGPSMTDTSHAGITDINEIVRRFARGGYLPPDENKRRYADVTVLQQPLTERIAFRDRMFSEFEEYLAERAREAPTPAQAAPVSVSSPTAPAAS